MLALRRQESFNPGVCQVQACMEILLRGINNAGGIAGRKAHICISLLGFGSL